MALDDRGVTDLIEDRMIPDMILDGHSNRMELAFLEYITGKGTGWVVYLGVLQGTFYWQVPDNFKEQKSSYKIAMTKEKALFIEK